MTEFEVIGKRIPNIRSAPKAVGQAIYTDDIKLPNMLYGRVLRSPLPHAKILHVDASLAEALPGVKAVMTGHDIPQVRVGALPAHADYYVMAVDKVRHIGEGVAAVAAIDEETAEEALALIRVDYEPLPAVLDPEEAIKPGAPRIHEAAENNISASFAKTYGDVEKGFRESDHIREDTFRTAPIAHAPLEPLGCVALWHSNDSLTVWMDTQTPFLGQRSFAKLFGLQEDRVRLIKTETGGGFGGKGELLAHHFACAYFSRLTGRPVKIALSREEVFLATRQRHPVILTVKTGVKRDGTLMSQELKVLADGGAYLSTGPLMLTIICFQAALPYVLPNLRYDGKRAYTNKPTGGPMQGHGVPQLRFAVDSQLDLIARDLGIDPLNIRLKNAIYTGYEHPAHSINSCGFREAIEEVGRALRWKERKGRLPDGHGLGIAGSAFISGVKMFPNMGGSITIQINSDAGVNVLSGAADIGQGTDTVICQIVAEELGVRMEDVRITSADTAITPFDQGSFSSGVTLRVGNAAIQAARDVKKQLLEVVAPHLEARPEELESRGGMVFVKGHRERGIDFAKAMRIYRYANKPMPLIGRGAYVLSTDDMVTMISKGGKQSPAYSFMCQGAEVKVDRQTGEIQVLNLVTGHDCGRVINPINVEGQLEGAVSKGIAMAYLEDLPHKDGQYLATTFLDYLMPTSLDHPAHFPFKSIETEEPAGPFGAKESGEGNLVSVAPAIANAVYDAIGVRIKDLPLTPDRIKKALEEQK